MYPYLFHIGGFSLASYGVLVALGYIFGVYYIRRKMPRGLMDDDSLWNFILFIVLGAVFGGKILYAILYWHEFGTDFLSRLWGVIREFRFGFVFYGGFLGAFAAGYWYIKHKKLSPFVVADYCAPAIALGHTFGRIGCFMAGCCHGGPSGAWPGVKFCRVDSLVDRDLLCIPVHPVQLYEAAGNLIIFLVLNKLLSCRRGFVARDGMIFALYGASYALLRFMLEYLRGDDRGGLLLGLSPSQLVALAVFTACAAFAVSAKLREKKNG